MEELHLVGFTVMRCSVDFQFRLTLARPAQAVRGQEWASVIIEGPFEFVDDGLARAFDPNGPHPEDLGPALKLRRKTIEAAIISDDGGLQLQFSDQLSLHVPSLPQYEAWELFEGDGKHIICLPGGGLATWPAPMSRRTAGGRRELGRARRVAPTLL
jgi:Family of unknown function (DUF6188)